MKERARLNTLDPASDQNIQLHRCFVGVALAQKDNRVIDDLLNPYKIALQQGGPSDFTEKLRWTASSNRHLTWVFLGNLSNQQLQQLQPALQQQLCNCSPFNLTFNAIAPFPSGKKPVAIALCATATAASLDTWRRVKMACGNLLTTTAEESKLREKRFLPHITVARLGTRLQRHPLRSSLPVSETEISIAINNVTIFLSQRTFIGSRYQSYAQIDLPPLQIEN